MKALRLERVGQLELVDIPRPEPKPDQLLVRTGACVICTSDLADLRDNPFHIRLPMVMGHEAAGAVAAVGPSVRGFRVGDRVAAHPVHPCGQCVACREHHGHLCRNMSHLGLDMQGAMAEYFVVRADRARVIPTAADFAVAALMEPVCVCLEALAQSRLRPGERLLILGDGPFAVLMTRLAVARNLGRLVLAGHHDFRLAFAADAITINTTAAERPREEIMAPVDGRGYDAVIVSVADSQAVREGMELLKPKGRLVLFAPISGETPIDLFRVVTSELEILGACNDEDRLDEAAGVLFDKTLDLASLITHRFPIDRYREAFELAAAGKDRAMKVAITFQT